jgi:hypothetical protein
MSRHLKESHNVFTDTPSDNCIEFNGDNPNLVCRDRKSGNQLILFWFGMHDGMDYPSKNKCMRPDLKTHKPDLWSDFEADMRLII